MDEIELNAELNYNPALLGQFLDSHAGQFNCVSFSDFLVFRTEPLTRPTSPNRPHYLGNNKVKEHVFNQVWIVAQQQYKLKIKDYEIKKKQQEIFNKYPADWSGYAHYLTENSTVAAPFLSRRHKVPVCEQNRQLHTYITGGTGSGKSEAIKTFIYHYLTRNLNTGLMLLTPHGKIAQEVAQMRFNVENDRLVYINPDLSSELYPCLNPFDIEESDNLTDREAENYAEEFRAVFQELLSDVFTEQMNALLKNTLPVLVKYPNSSVYDLIDFLSESQKKFEKYLSFAYRHFKNKAMLEFLQGQFVSDKSYKRTKNSMLTRLQSIFNTTLMQAVLKGKSTINLEDLINQKKLIVFDISKGTSPQEWDVIGKLIIAMVKIIAFRREKIDENQRTPCHLFIDEFQNYITPSIQEILEESRKYKLYLTLAQQTAGARMSKELLRSIMSNTGVKLTGRNGDIETLSLLAKSTGADLDELKTNLATGRFSLWLSALTGEHQKAPFIVTMPKNTLNNRASMTAEQWQGIIFKQLSCYYRSLDIKLTPDKQKPVETQKTPEKTHGVNLSDYLN